MTSRWLITGGGGKEGQGEETLGSWIIDHLKDGEKWLGAKLPTFPSFNIAGVEVDLSISLHVVMLWLATAILVLVLVPKFRNAARVPKGFFSGALESMVLFVRDEIAVPNMGKSLGTKMTPFLCTLFFFILTLNLIGLVPTMSTATANISVTAGLAIVTFLLTQLYGIKENGIGGYLKHLVPSGVPVFLLPIMIPIEILGLFTKPFALAMRLFANMIAGHTVIFALLGLIIVLQSVIVAPVSVGLAIAIYCLELFVAFLQAFIFVMLSALFIGMSAHGGH